MRKIHRKQIKFYKDKARNRWIFGGNRTGKTHCGAQEAVWRACCTHPYVKIRNASEGWVVSLSTQVQRDVAQRKVLELLDMEGFKYECVMQSGKTGSPVRGVIDFITVYNKFETESRIGFRNCEQGREKFQGTSLDWVWFDEEPGEDIYEECLMRTMDRGGIIWGTMTPLKGRTWVYDRIFLATGKEISVISMSWDDNPFLLDAEKRKMKQNFSSDTLESREFGRFTEGTGLVFKEFCEENIVKNVTVPSILAASVYNGISIDPGYTNPTAVLWFALDYDGRIFVIQDYKKAGISVEQISKEIIYKSNELGVDIKNVFIDSAAAARTLAEPRSVAEQFRAHGINVNTEVYKNVNEGLHRVKALFCSAEGVRRLFVLEHCTHLIKELRSYFWADNEKPVKSNDHCIDALRYFCMSFRVPEPKAPKKTSLEKFKRRLLNEKV